MYQQKFYYYLVFWYQDFVCQLSFTFWHIWSFPNADGVVHSKYYILKTLF